MLADDLCEAFIESKFKIIADSFFIRQGNVSGKFNSFAVGMNF